MERNRSQKKTASANVTGMLTSRRVRWWVHTARMREVKMRTQFWWENLKEETTWKTQE
jgi:hypothetical protein